MKFKKTAPYPSITNVASKGGNFIAPLNFPGTLLAISTHRKITAMMKQILHTKVTFEKKRIVEDLIIELN